MMNLRKMLLGAAFLLSTSLAALAATSPFLWEPGTSNNGLYASTLTLMTTELNGVTNTSLAVSSVGGSSGVFSNSNTAQVMYSPAVFTVGTSGFTPSANGTISCWDLESVDGSTFENTSNAPARSADFVFNFSGRSYAAAEIVLNTGRLSRVPALKFKLLCINNTGATLPATSNTIVLAPIAGEY